jgi:hypothetical protein
MDFQSVLKEEGEKALKNCKSGKDQGYCGCAWVAVSSRIKNMPDIHKEFVAFLKSHGFQKDDASNSYLLAPYHIGEFMGIKPNEHFNNIDRKEEFCLEICVKLQELGIKCRLSTYLT